jgi:hypothetical protein
MQLTPKQKELYNLISQPYRYYLVRGGSRSGKTFALVNCIINRAVQHPKTDHIIMRLHYSYAKNSIVNQTIPNVLSAKGSNWDKVCNLNKTDLIYNFKNGSRIFVAGIDDRLRMEKILGAEYSTIFLNEISQIDYSVFELLKTRLNAPGKDISLKMFLDCNPGRVGCWDYQIWNKHKYPDGRDVEVEKYTSIQINPVDNPYNSSDYLSSLAELTPAMRKRFEKGEYGTDERLLFTSPLMDGVIGADAIMHIDAAYGGEDTTAITVGDKCNNRYGKVFFDHVDNHIGEIKSIFDRYKCRKCYCEANGDKGYLAKSLRVAHIPTEVYYEKENKVIKIASILYPVWKNLHWVKETDNNYMNQILDWCETTRAPDKDDAPDSAASLQRIINAGEKVKMTKLIE